MRHARRACDESGLLIAHSSSAASHYGRLDPDQGAEYIQPNHQAEFSNHHYRRIPATSLGEVPVNVLKITWLYKLWDQLRSSYWFIPTLLVLISILLAAALISADHQYRFDQDTETSWLFLGKSESARSILSIIATAMITIVSLTFSMTIVVLTLASSQFGPRLLYNFMRDRSNQIALGVFLACFSFCLFILRTVQTDSPQDFVPHLGTTAAMLYAALSIGVLIYFIHHVAESIQANTIIANVRHELETIVGKTIPDTPEAHADDEAEWKRLLDLLDRILSLHPRKRPRHTAGGGPGGADKLVETT